MANGDYIFTVGAKKDQPRVYSGTLLSPVMGFRLGAKVLKMMAAIIKDIESSSAIKKLLSDAMDGQAIAGIDLDNDTMLEGIISFMADCLANWDIDEYMFLVHEVIAKTSIYAKVDGETGPGTQINSEGDMNKWFTKYRGDMAIFTAHILARNSAPFLPEDWAALLLSKSSTQTPLPSP